jgi:hypothetical protein
MPHHAAEEVTAVLAEAAATERHLDPPLGAGEQCWRPVMYLITLENMAGRVISSYLISADGPPVGDHFGDHSFLACSALRATRDGRGERLIRGRAWAWI